MEMFAYGGLDPGTIKAFLHLTERITRGFTTPDILSHLPQTSDGRPLSYLSIYSDSPLLPNTWSQAASAVAGPSLVPPPTSFRKRMTPSTKGLAPSLASSRRRSSIYDARSPRAASTMLSERTAVERGDRGVSPDLVDEPEGETGTDTEDEHTHGGNGQAQRQKEEEAKKGKKSRRRFWLFKKKPAEPELKVHGPVKDLLDRAVWTMQTGHRATGMVCCDQCCDCEDKSQGVRSPPGTHR